VAQPLPGAPLLSQRPEAAEGVPSLALAPAGGGGAVDAGVGAGVGTGVGWGVEGAFSAGFSGACSLFMGRPYSAGRPSLPRPAPAADSRIGSRVGLQVGSQAGSQAGSWAGSWVGSWAGFWAGKPRRKRGLRRRARRFPAAFAAFFSLPRSADGPARELRGPERGRGPACPATIRGFFFVPRDRGARAQPVCKRTTHFSAPPQSPARHALTAGGSHRPRPPPECGRHPPPKPSGPQPVVAPRLLCPKKLCR